MMRWIYLHGFGSSPQSKKATYLSRRLAEHGIQLEVPALEQPNFTEMTLSGQVAFVQAMVSNTPSVLLGSSMGGYVAALVAARNPAVQKLILLAPAFDLQRLWSDWLGPAKLTEWEQRGVLLFPHYAHGREEPLKFQFFQDLLQYEPYARVECPVLIIHGTQDEVVPIEVSREFARQHKHARLVEVPSNHELTDVLEQIYEEICRFTGLNSEAR